MSITKYKQIGLALGVFLILLSLCLVIFLSVDAEDPDLFNTYYTVNAISNNQNYGTVTVTGSSPNPNELGSYLYGTKVNLKAEPINDRYRFVRWEGDGITTTSNPFELTVGDGIAVGTAHSYTAIFEPMSYPITIVEDSRLKFDGSTAVPTEHVYGTDTPLPTPQDTMGYTFEGWQVESGGKTDTYAKGTSLGAYAFSDAIKLTPIFKERPFSVKIYDVPTQFKELFEMITNSDSVDPSKLLNTSQILLPSYYGAQNVSPVDESLDYYRMYRGYYFTKATDSYKILAEVTANEKLNFAIRYFTPKTYQIIYEGLEDAALVSPEFHTYGTTTTIRTPERAGYTFTGWRILEWNGENYKIAENYTDASNNLQIGPDDFDNPNWTEENKNTREVSIILEAQWRVNVYSVDYEGVSPEQESALIKERPYDQSFTLPNTLTRTGYTFIGWRIQNSGTEFTLNFSIPASSLVGNVVIEAGWKANNYTVTLDPGHADAVAGDTSATVTFDSPFPDNLVKPTREGYTFLGYSYGQGAQKKWYYYYDEATDAWTCVNWDLAQDGCTLYGEWRINQMAVTVDSALLNVADVTVNGIPYTGTPMLFDYNTVITIEVTMKNGYKLVKWEGVAIPHTAFYTAETFQLKADTPVLGGSYALALETPAFKVDYKSETFKVNGSEKLPAGSYKLVCDGTTLFFKVAEDGTIEFTDLSKVTKLSAGAYIGTGNVKKLVEITLCGDGETTADSDAQKIEVEPRPAKPTDDLNNGDIDYISGLDYSIVIRMKENSFYQFEFAISLDGKSELIWTRDPSNPTIMQFANLKGGTPYYIYIRVAASDTHPHGEVYQTLVQTLPNGYLNKMIDDLMDLGGQAGDGENVKKLLEETKAAMEQVKASETFVDDLDKLYKAAAEKIALARVQDAALKTLVELRDSLKKTGAYHEVEGYAALDACFDAAKASVNAAATESEVQRILVNAEKEFFAVPITYLSVNEIKLSSGGMDREYILAGSRMQLSADMVAKVKRSIAANTFVVDPNCSLSLADAEKMLGSMDVLAYYNLSLRHKDPLATDPIAPFTVRLLIPEELQGETGLMAAYHSDATGLTVLETRREGNELVFVADRIADFVILGDHAVNLTGLIASLCAILLCQIIGLAILLVCRRKAEKSMKHYSVALPAFALAIRFFPANSLTVVILLAALAVILQIVLLWLLLKSELLFRKKREGVPAKQMPAAQSEADETSTELAESESQGEEPMLVPFTTDSVVEEELYEAVEALPADDGAEEPDWAEAPLFEADTEADEPAADPISEDWYGDNGFIEPAAVPRYSLPDEAFEEASETLASENEEDFYSEMLEESTNEGFDLFEESENDDGSAYAYHAIEDMETDMAYNSDAARAEAVFDEPEMPYAEENFEDTEYTDANEAFAESEYVEDEIASVEELTYADDADSLEELMYVDGAEEEYDPDVYEDVESSDALYAENAEDYAESEFDPAVYESDPQEEESDEEPPIRTY